MQNTIIGNVSKIFSYQLLKLRIVRRQAEILSFALLIGIVVSFLIPPFQSPDEFDHIKRAYFLSNGQLLLESPKTSSSGGQIDNGLLSYMNAFEDLPTKEKNKVTREKIEESKKERWKGTSSFSPAPGTGYYLPLIYFPQTVGLLIGKSLDLTIDHSYRLVRFLSLSVSLAIVSTSTRIFSINFLALASLVLPMTVFQLVSASIDGTSTAIGILSISIFMRAADKRLSYPTWASWLLAIALLLLVTSRAHLLPLLGMPLVVFFFRKKKLDFFLFLAVTILTLTWLYIAIHHTVDLRESKPEKNYTPIYIISHYLSNPTAFFAIIWSTLIDSEIRQFYQMSFIGILGWLDVYLERWFYNLSILLYICLGILSIQWNNIKSDWPARACLLVFAIISTLMVFFLLLVSWTQHPALTISGVQGRYFLVPFMLFAYSLSGSTNTFSSRKKFVALPLLYSYCLIVSFVIPQALIYRYFLQ